MKIIKRKKRKYYNDNSVNDKLINVTATRERCEKKREITRGGGLGKEVEKVERNKEAVE